MWLGLLCLQSELTFAAVVAAAVGALILWLPAVLVVGLLIALAVRAYEFLQDRRPRRPRRARTPAGAPGAK